LQFKTKVGIINEQILSAWIQCGLWAKYSLQEQEYNHDVFTFAFYRIGHRWLFDHSVTFLAAVADFWLATDGDFRAGSFEVYWIYGPFPSSSIFL
jgi:hypothetical protein